MNRAQKTRCPPLVAGFRRLLPSDMGSTFRRTKLPSLCVCPRRVLFLKDSKRGQSRGFASFSRLPCSSFRLDWRSLRLVAFDRFVVGHLVHETEEVLAAGVAGAFGNHALGLPRAEGLGQGE